MLGRLAIRLAFLALVLVAVVFIMSLAVNATPYGTSVLKSVVNTKVQVYEQQLIAKGYSQAQAEKLAAQYKAKLEREYGLSGGLLERSAKMTINVLTFHLGYVSSDEVIGVIGARPPIRVSSAVSIAFWRTLLLFTTGYVLGALAALYFGAYASLLRGTWVDKASVAYVILMIALPAWWLGIISVFLFGYKMGIAPTDYRVAVAYLNSHDVIGFLKTAWLPILIVAASAAGSWLYAVREISIRMHDAPFIELAEAKGLPTRVVLRRYLLRPMLPAVMSVIMLSLAMSVGSTVVSEVVFNWPGLGALLYAAVSAGDAPVVLGATYFIVLFYVVIRAVFEVVEYLTNPSERR